MVATLSADALGDYALGGPTQEIVTAVSFTAPLELPVPRDQQASTRRSIRSATTPPRCVPGWSSRRPERGTPPPEATIPRSFATRLDQRGVVPRAGDRRLVQIDDWLDAFEGIGDRGRCC